MKLHRLCCRTRAFLGVLITGWSLNSFANLDQDPRYYERGLDGGSGWVEVPAERSSLGNYGEVTVVPVELPSVTVIPASSGTRHQRRLSRENVIYPEINHPYRDSRCRQGC